MSREIDVRIAKALGWELLNSETLLRAKTEDDYEDARTNDGWYWTGYCENEAWEWSPSDKWSCAGELIEMMNRRGFTFGFMKVNGLKNWQAHFSRDKSQPWVDGVTGSDAITRAALAALESK